MQRIYRHYQLYGRESVFGISRSKYFAGFLVRPGIDPFIPGTRIRRMRTIRLGPKARGVPESEVQRVVSALSRDADQIADTRPR
jgi:hypothetical protein